MVKLRGGCRETVAPCFCMTDLRSHALFRLLLDMRQGVGEGGEEVGGGFRGVVPEGRYAVVIAWSKKRKMWLPTLLGGPDFNHLFKGIRIHAGHTAADTAGCILVGRNQIVGQLLESRKWLYELKRLIVEAKARGEAVWLTIK